MIIGGACQETTEPLGHDRLTPLYDIVSALPVMGRGPNLIEPREARLAMAPWGANRHHRIAEIQRRHFVATAAECRLRGGAEPIIERVLAAVPDVIASVGAMLPADFPARVAEPTLEVLRSAAARLEAMPPA